MSFESREVIRPVGVVSNQANEAMNATKVGLVAALLLGHLAELKFGLPIFDLRTPDSASLKRWYEAEIPRRYIKNVPMLSRA
jgi:hypothetical protein